MQWMRDALTVLFGALAGGLTNRVAITMLFHPYEPPRVFGRTVHWLQGAVPKNQTRMARTIGNTVGDTLLTPADVAAELKDERLRDAFEKQLQGSMQELFEGEKPAIGDLLPESALEEVRRILDTLLDSVRDRVVEALSSDEFSEDAARILGTLAESLEDESLAESLGQERIAGLRNQADEWVTKLVESDSFALTVRSHLDRAAVRLLRPGRSFEELLPVGLVAALEHAISDYLPIAMERLGRLLEDPAARARVEGAIHDLLDRFMKDLRFHQRVVAKLIITEETVDKVIDTLEAEGADRLGDAGGRLRLVAGLLSRPRRGRSGDRLQRSAADAGRQQRHGRLQGQAHYLPDDAADAQRRRLHHGVGGTRDAPIAERRTLRLSETDSGIYLSGRR